MRHPLANVFGFLGDSVEETDPEEEVKEEKEEEPVAKEKSEEKEVEEVKPVERHRTGKRPRS